MEYYVQVELQRFVLLPLQEGVRELRHRIWANQMV